MTITDAAAMLAAGKVSSVELTEACLGQIERLNPKLNAFLTVTAGHALEQARASDARRAGGAARGPLDGIPVALKDVFCTKGIRTTCGSLLFEHNIPEIDSAVTERLAGAGAVMLGKTGMHELAYGVTSANPHFGAVRNPWNVECIPGGSSGGSGSAVAAEMAFMAMGSDTGGSIRIPAAYCGTVGLKPTSGRVSRYGVMPLDYTLDHMGPLTRSVRDAALVMNVLAGYDERDETSSIRPVKDFVPAAGVGLEGVRIGVPSNFYFDRAAAETIAAVRRMVQLAAGLGARVEVVKVPDIAALNVIGRVILMSEASALMEKYVGDRAKFGADVLALFDQGRLLAATDYINAQRLRRMFVAEFRKLFESIDCLLTPCAPIGAPKIGQAMVDIAGEAEDTRLASTRYVRGINVLGLPALSMPCGFDAAGMPLGLQIIGRAFEEDLVLRVGAALEDATDFHTRRPV